jgi:predicted transcriptional regulator
MSDAKDIQATLSVDEVRLLSLIRMSKPDSDFEVNKRNGRIVNMKITEICASMFTNAALALPQGKGVLRD